MAVALAALFFSLTGVGFAASRWIITSKRQIAPWVRASLHGAQGPRGFTGATGTRGTVGPRGATGSPGFIDWSATYFLTGPAVTLTADGSDATAAVQCRPGDHALTGGFIAHGAIVRNDSIVIGAQSPGNATPADGWFAIATIAPSASAGDMTVWVRCVRG